MRSRRHLHRRACLPWHPPLAAATSFLGLKLYGSHGGERGVVRRRSALHATSRPTPARAHAGARRERGRLQGREEGSQGRGQGRGQGPEEAAGHAHVAAVRARGREWASPQLSRTASGCCPWGRALTCRRPRAQAALQASAPQLHGLGLSSAARSPRRWHAAHLLNQCRLSNAALAHHAGRRAAHLLEHQVPAGGEGHHHEGGGQGARTGGSRVQGARA